MQCVSVDPYTSPSFTLFEAYDYDMLVGKRKLKNHIDRMPFFFTEWLCLQGHSL